MYQMYPDTWAAQATRPADTACTPARRRVRREHRILPVVADAGAAGRSLGAPGH